MRDCGGKVYEGFWDTLLLTGFWGIEGFREQYLSFGAIVRVWDSGNDLYLAHSFSFRCK